MDHPHSTHKVVALCFHPHLPVAITVGQDQRFKVWQLGEPERRKGIAGMRSPHTYPRPKPRPLNC